MHGTMTWVRNGPDARLAVNRLASRALGSRLAGRGELGEHARARRSFAHCSQDTRWGLAGA